MQRLQVKAWRAVSVLLIATVCWFAPLSRAAEVENTVVLVRSGDRAPDNTGDLSSLALPVHHGGGQAAFVSDIVEDGFVVGDGVYRVGPSGDPIETMRSGNPSPDGNGNFGTMALPIVLVNGAGQVAFRNDFDLTLGGAADSDAIVIGDGNSSAIVARIGQTPLGSPGILQGLFEPSGLNQAGQVCFPAFVQGSLGVFRGDGSPGSLVSIVVPLQTLPSGEFLVLGSGLTSAINASGQVAFSAFVDGLVIGALFVGDGASPLVEIMRSGDPTPSGNGVFSAVFAFFSNHPLNDHGEVAFASLLSGTAGGTTDNLGLYLGDGSTTFELARKGDPAPDGNGSLLAFAPQIDLDDAGRVVFHASVTGASGGATDGLFIADKNSVRQIARRNAAAPGGGVFADMLAATSLSDTGGVVFRSFVNLNNGGSANDQVGIFFFDGVSVQSIAREGDTLAGSGTLTSVDLVAFTETEGIEGNAIGANGQVAFRFTSSGDFSIALWSAPPLFEDGFETGDTTAWAAP